MIIVQLNKDDYAYDIHSLVKAFYPSENVSVYTVPKDISEPVQLHMFVDYEQNKIRLRLAEPGTKLQDAENKLQDTENRQRDAEVRLQKPEDVQPDKNTCRETIFSVNEEDRRDTKNRLKQNIYQMLSAHTGRTLPWGTLTGIRPTKISMTLLYKF